MTSFGTVQDELACKPDTENRRRPVVYVATDSTAERDTGSETKLRHSVKITGNRRRRTTIPH
jgi:hypothetical protein